MSLCVLLCALWFAVSTINSVSAQGPLLDADGLLAPVCSFCNCQEIPLANASLAVNARVVSVVSSDWKQFTMQDVTGVPFGLFFKSVDASCRVEIKLTTFNTTYVGGLFVFPFGRQNLTVVQGVLGNAPWYCSPWEWPPYVRLGKSALSIGDELGLQLVISRNSSMNLELNYRKWCSSVIPDTPRGFALPAIPADGSMRVVNLTGFLSNQTQTQWLSWANITWETSKSSNCALEVTFQRTPLYTYLNQNVRVIPWMIYKLPTGVAALIDVTSLLLLGGRDIALEVSYRAVDCGTPQNQIEITSWNDSLVLLNYSTEWREVDRMFSNSFAAPRQLDLAVFFVTTEMWPEDRVPFIFERAGFPVNPTGGWPSRFYESEFNRTFGAILPRNTLPIVLFLEHTSERPGASVEAFYYRAVARSQVFLVQASKRPGSWKRLMYSLNKAPSLQVEFRPSNLSCFIQAKVTYSTNDPIWMWPIPTFLLDPTGNPGLNIQVVDQVVQSLSGQLVLRLDYSVLSAHPTILFRQVCPESLTVRAQATHHSNWSYNNVSVDRHPVFVLPPLEAPWVKRGCRYQISGIGMPIDVMSHIQVMCLSWNDISGLEQRSLTLYAKLSPLQSIDLANCSHGGNGTSIYIQAAPGWSLFAYRMTCESDVTSTAPYPATIGPVLRAVSDKWRTLTYPNRLLPLTIMAANRDCQVEIKFDWVDLFGLAIYEDFVRPDDYGYDPSLFQNQDTYDNLARFPNFQYLSYTSRVILKETPTGVWSSSLFSKHSRFRQVCSAPRPEKFIREMTYNVSNTEWRILEGSAINANQMIRLSYRLNPMFTADDQVLELDFISLVSQIWVGHMNGRYGNDARAETHHGLMIDHRYPAVVGKQFMFKRGVTLTPYAVVNLKPGDHWFTMRYRIVPFGDAKRERDLGEVLIAKDKPQELAFRIPKQFSQQGAKAAVVENQLDDYYTSSGEYDVWSYKHRYTIQPASPECRVVLQFKKIDIGPGHVSRRPHSKMDQHRLSVVRDATGIASQASKECFSSLKHNFTDGNSTDPICARIGQTYVAPRSNTSLVVLFRSTKLLEEYEYESPTNNWRFEEHRFYETTWGSGWTATYRQVCSGQHMSQSLYPVPITLKAKSSKWRMFKLPMPARYIKSNSQMLHSFVDKRWMIVPEDPDHCFIRIRIRDHSVRTLASFTDNGRFWLLSKSADLDRPKVLLILTRDVYAYDFPKVQFRQVCLEY